MRISLNLSIELLLLGAAVAIVAYILPFVETPLDETGRIDTSNLSKGGYIITVSDGKRSASRKLFIE